MELDDDALAAQRVWKGWGPGVDARAHPVPILGALSYALWEVGGRGFPLSRIDEWIRWFDENPKKWT